MTTCVEMRSRSYLRETLHSPSSDCSSHPHVITSLSTVQQRLRLGPNQPGAFVPRGHEASVLDRRLVRGKRQ